jgi:4,5-DOPA dioxygenase extradiol
MMITRRDFLGKIALGALAFGLPGAPMDVYGESKASERMPVLFVGHGSPLNAIEDTRFAEGWRNVGRNLPRPSAILCVSAHWRTEEFRVTTNEHPETIYDFWGFPEELYDVIYPAPGSPPLANSLSRMVSKAPITPDPIRGFDHGCWAVLVRMFPGAEIPLIQLSLNQSLSPSAQCDLAKELSPLRQKGVLIVCSGNIVHNLRVRRPKDSPPYDWALEFDALAKELIQKADLRSLLEYERLGESARLSIPTNEHYLPALYALALREDSEPITFFNEGIVSGAVSMRGFQIGDMSRSSFASRPQ